MAKRYHWLTLDTPSGPVQVYSVPGLDVHARYHMDKGRIDVRTSTPYMMTMALVHEVCHISTNHLSSTLKKHCYISNKKEELIVSLVEYGLFHTFFRSGFLEVPKPPKTKGKK